ncbi:serine hydrolase [Glycomyces xiaoerkulensis]|uniref:serine hydrolase n=1 Tax=Glycomyces xiaoerkulensis TaxID=2038139 RepID=UPI000C256766|nr:serine hydrolase [Glycomyces xiaoerkulensis]
MQRRGVFKFGAGLTALGATVGAGTGCALVDTVPLEPDPVYDAAGAADRIRRIFEAESTRAGGTWQAKITLLDGAERTAAVDTDSGARRTAASVNKLGIAVAVLDKVDRGELALDDRITLDPDLVIEGSGLYFHQTAYGDELTVANVLVTLLMPSDNTAVRLCGLLCAPEEVNRTLEAKGFTDTRVVPSDSDPNRMGLGETTPAETTDLLVRLAGGDLLSQAAGGFLLGILRGLSGYHDGFRRNMSSAERSRIALKYGADGPTRNESGLVFGDDGAPVLVYSLMAQLDGHHDDYGATHPAVQAHAAMGRRILDVLDRIEPSA